MKGDQGWHRLVVELAPAEVGLGQCYKTFFDVITSTMGVTSAKITDLLPKFVNY